MKLCEKGRQDSYLASWVAASQRLWSLSTALGGCSSLMPTRSEMKQMCTFWEDSFVLAFLHFEMHWPAKTFQISVLLWWEFRLMTGMFCSQMLSLMADSSGLPWAACLHQTNLICLCLGSDFLKWVIYFVNPLMIFLDGNPARAVNGMSHRSYPSCFCLWGFPGILRGRRNIGNAGGWTRTCETSGTVYTIYNNLTISTTGLTITFIIFIMDFLTQ